MTLSYHARFSLRVFDETKRRWLYHSGPYGSAEQARDEGRKLCETHTWALAMFAVYERNRHVATVAEMIETDRLRVQKVEVNACPGCGGAMAIERGFYAREYCPNCG